MWYVVERGSIRKEKAKNTSLNAPWNKKQKKRVESLDDFEKKKERSEFESGGLETVNESHSGEKRSGRNGTLKNDETK